MRTRQAMYGGGGGGGASGGGAAGGGGGKGGEGIILADKSKLALLLGGNDGDGPGGAPMGQGGGSGHGGGLQRGFEMTGGSPFGEPDVMARPVPVRPAPDHYVGLKKQQQQKISQRAGP